MKNERGEITIMMIITVIVFIILGGICIFMLTGENGIFVPRRDNEEIKKENDTIIQNEVQEENTTNNENGALTVPMQ